MASAPHAAAITVKSTLDLLDGPFALLASGIAQDRYAFWLGSGISLGRVEGLRQLVPRVLQFLQTRVGIGDATCRFRRALDDALNLAAVTPVERALIELERPVAEWPNLDAIVNRLVSNYARFLEIAVTGEDDDYLLWEGVNVVDTYGDPAIEPDVEHLCIAILVREGLSSKIASANWDGLIEKAADELSGGAPSLVVCVHPDDLRKPHLQARLYKFHGCAVCAGVDEARYRTLLIARQSQINGWTERAENAALRNHLIDIAVTKPTLMMGLSAQDANIQSLFAAAENRMAWPWPSDPPAYVFSEDQLGVDQRGLLKNVYHAAYTAATRDQIYNSALIRAFAKSLLSSIVLRVTSAKLGVLIELGAPNISQADRAIIFSGVIHLRNAVADSANPNDATFVRKAVAHSARIMALFHDGDATAAQLPYRPVTSRPIQHLAGDHGLAASGLREFAIALGLLGLGAKNEAWKIEAVDVSDPKEGALRVISAAGPTKLFVASNPHAALRLIANGHLTDDEDAIMVHSLDIAAPMARSPRGPIGRKGRPGLREVSISQLLAEVTTSGELLQRFREELAL
jgi:hypothetical protein